MSNITPIAYDAESEAYLKRFPELRPLIAEFGAAGPRLHYENFGRNQGLTWGLDAPVATTPAAPVETVATRPAAPMYGNDAAGWDAWMTAGRQAAEGVNEMPGVFSAYGTVPTDDKAANALFYPGSTPAAVPAANPLLSGNPMMGGVASTPGVMSAASNPLLSGGSSFDQITAAGPDTYAAPLIEVVGQRGSMSPEEAAAYMRGQEYYFGR